eukprot:Opistho-1_new@38660
MNKPQRGTRARTLALALQANAGDETFSHEHAEVSGVRHRSDVGVRHAIEGREVGLHVGRHRDECALIAHLVAIVRRREHRQAPAVVHLLVALVLHLVAPHNVVETVEFAETLRDVGAKVNADAALAGRPARLRLRIRPQQLAHEAGLGGFPEAVDLANVIKGDVVGAEQSAVHHQHTLVDAMGQRQPVEHFVENRDHLLVVLVLCLAVEAVHLVHVVALVVPAVHEEVVRVEQLEGEEREDALDGERAAVHKVAVEHVRVFPGRHSVELENVEQVVKLAVNVAANRKLAVLGERHVDERREAHHQLARFEENLEGILAVKLLLLAVVLKELRHEFDRHVLAEMGAVVVGLHHHRIHFGHVNNRLLVVGGNGLLKGDALDNLLALLELQVRVVVVGSELHHRLEVPEAFLELAQRHVRRRTSVVRLDVRLVHFDRLRRILQRIPKALHAEVRKRAVGIVRRDVRVENDGLGVLLYGLVKPLLLKQLVPLLLARLGKGLVLVGDHILPHVQSPPPRAQQREDCVPSGTRNRRSMGDAQQTRTCGGAPCTLR